MKQSRDRIAPGLEIIDGFLLTCPGCGLRALGYEPPYDLEIVTAWFRGAFAALTDLGAQGFTENLATENALRYVENPWCNRG